MALAKNLSGGKLPKFKKPKNNKYLKYVIVAVVILAILLGVYGIINLSRVAPKEEEKGHLELNTGDAPLPEKIKIWTTAKGGLNLRSEPSTESEIVATIPEDTELTAEELSGDWYRVIYDGNEGWVHKDYVRTFKEEDSSKESGATEGWESYKNSTYGYSTLRPEDWVTKDYGKNEAGGLVSYVAFGPQLADELNPSLLPPVVIKTTDTTLEDLVKVYAKKTDAKVSDVTVAGTKAKKYTYTASSGVQMTAYLASGSSYSYILEESGGYSEELDTVAKNFKLL